MAFVSQGSLWREHRDGRAAAGSAPTTAVATLIVNGDAK
jgi:hypothetical protein